MRKTNLDITGTIQHKSLQILAYADVVVIVGRHENAVKDVFYRLETEAQKMPLKIMTKQNVRKQKKKNNREIKEEYIRIINRDMEKVNKFKYLGYIITNNNITSVIKP